MTNYILQTHTTNPWENLALESALLSQIKPNDVILYLWQNQNTVVIGKNQNPWKECRTEQLEQDGGYLSRRNTGGGAVFHDLGNLNFTFIASPSTYNLPRHLKVICDACQSYGINATFSGRNDIIIDQKKFSGNAFAFTKNASMHHGTLLIDVDMQKLGAYLMPSKEKMQAKGVESVRSRVCNLTQFAPKMTTDTMRLSLQQAFKNEYGSLVEFDLGTIDSFMYNSLLEKYASWEWRYGKTFDFDVSFSNRFTWGDIEMLLQLKNGMINDVQFFSDAMNPNISNIMTNTLIGVSYGLSMIESIRSIKTNSDEMYIYNDIANWLAQKYF